MSHKNVLLLYPKLRDINKINVTNIINTLHELDYKIFIKTRGKDPIHDVSSFKGIVIHDGDWFPHPSIDLMYACDFVINFDSTAIKEAAVLKTPVINYHIKPKGHGAPTRLDFLLNENFIFHVQDNIDHLKQTIKTIEMTDFSNYFEKTIQAKFFNRREVCKKILSFIK
jgi:predicted glycosyltransferase